MTENYGRKADSAPAVYNQRSTGVTPSNSGPLQDLTAQHEARGVLEQQRSGGQASDVHTTSATRATSLQEDTPLRIGRVLLAMPYIHCYKIQLNGRQGTCIATAIARSSHMSLGVRAGDVIPVNSVVLVWKPTSGTMAYILGTIPLPTMHDDFNAAEHLQQGGNSGPKKVEAYRNIPRAVVNAMGWVPQSSGRPMDGTNGEYVRMSETGIGLLIDSFQAYLRVNEVCGLWLNYFDNYTRLSGLSLDIQSYCEHTIQRYDEGESLAIRGYTSYPWESTGMYSPGEKFSVTNEAEEVQLDPEFPFALEDAKHLDQTPVYRLTDYTGYLGQGFNRTLMKPAKDSGVRRMSEAKSDRDTGLYQSLLTLDGDYLMRSAKSLTFMKYPCIPNPRRIRAAEDALGDDMEENGEYKFSGRFGDGQPHKVKDWDDSEAGQLKNLLRPAGILDVFSRHYNWKSTHPFFYHEKDYDYPEESELPNLNSVEFYRGTMSRSYVEIGPSGSLQIDERYSNVKYYKTMAFFTVTDDGSVLLGDGYGSQITMTGGQIRLEAGGDVMLLSGSRVISMGKEAILRAKGSVDISSSEKDVRLKAEKNLQVLGGNSGSGGVLIESKAKGTAQQYQDKLGEDVSASGIMLLSRGGNVSAVAGTVYVRSGVEESNAEGNGNIILDCANGRSEMVAYARSHAFYNSLGLYVWHRPKGQDEVNIDKSHAFTPFYSKISGPTVMQKSVVICDNGSLGVDRDVLSKGNMIALKAMACLDAEVGDSSKGKTKREVTRFIDSFCKLGDNLEPGPSLFQAMFKDFVWKEQMPGNTELLENHIGFSYRDRTELGGNVYGYSPNQFFMLETRWQQLGRTGLVDEGESWTENPVQYQSQELYPWPGRKHWKEDETQLQYENKDGKFLLFDTDKGCSKDRKSSQEDYEEPKFQDWKKERLEDSYKL